MVLKQVIRLIIRGYFFSKLAKKFADFSLNSRTIYPELFTPKQKDKILVLAPHADDESIGCAGVLSKFPSQCRVVCLTDGGAGDPSIDSSELSEARAKEFGLAMNLLEISDFNLLGVPDGRLSSSFSVFSSLEFKQYDYIFIPNYFDQHPDHRAVSLHVIKLLKAGAMKKDVKICFYEVWNAMPLPNYFVDITPYANFKRDLISVYGSQIKHIDYQNRILSLNNYRGMSVGVEYAECYTVFEADHFVQLFGR